MTFAAAAPYLNDLALWLMPILFGLALAWLRQWLVHRGYRTDVVDALDRAAGAGFKAATLRGLKPGQEDFWRVMEQHGVTYLKTTVAPAIAARALTDDDLLTRVAAAGGKLIAAAAPAAVADGVKAAVKDVLAEPAGLPARGAL